MHAHCFDNLPTDQRLPHTTDPPASDFGGNYREARRPLGMGSVYEEKIRGFFEENPTDAWIRIAVALGALIPPFSFGVSRATASASGSTQCGAGTDTRTFVGAARRIPLLALHSMLLPPLPPIPYITLLRLTSFIPLHCAFALYFVASLRSRCLTAAPFCVRRLTLLPLSPHRFHPTLHNASCSDFDATLCPAPVSVEATCHFLPPFPSAALRCATTALPPPPLRTAFFGPLRHSFPSLGPRASFRRDSLAPSPSPLPEPECSSQTRLATSLSSLRPFSASPAFSSCYCRREPYRIRIVLMLMLRSLPPAILFFYDEPKWIPHARSAGTDTNAHRVGYLRDIGAGILPAVGAVGA
ncbi:1,2-dihydroxy-3-keto-5-methylthiopentene dioxygenase [Mycena sanguinolenta]|uniref:1,2-dihydroxy-3-keto-5-methylthiopentene dioxygenase n=1 Tax=Mycena sanguinolenta TaxID=230812 RepID=A0A8H6Y8H8_9AGAR|nr:1,2-dihydroxy-3-keto-5-methylthiopentene dioxygenase [Mycena sanguinolenta]